MSTDYDVITVGGGLGGSALAKVLATHGTRVLVVEREVQFKDRVRGEWMAPWGAAEAVKLGIYDALLEHGAFEKPYFQFGGFPIRDLKQTTLPQLGSLNAYHPAMQEAVIDAARLAGATIWRGATIREIKPGDPPTVTVDKDGGIKRLKAKIVIGADGRSSICRTGTGLKSIHDTRGMLLAGVLFDGVAVTEDTSVMLANPAIGQIAYFFPQQGKRVRAYCALPLASGRRLQGTSDVADFVRECIRSGAPAAAYADAKAIGPLATFESMANWADLPYAEGIALVGDAAGTSDPVWGQGLSLTLRDARVLSEHLLSSNDWDAAAQAYARNHQNYFDTMHNVESWSTDLFIRTGKDADAARERAFPLIIADPTRVPDHLLSGPDLPCDELVRKRFFGEV
ncbi:MAG: FAD-dependent monooxygenase [Deltaproteobacteria bacterium]|nr:FAD-dependent monooxygenase [Deltaproteobacteria bacterium]MBV8451923.1 FAD-dependent monooxygenase [Deltaproteobacteria bacterium]